MLKSNTKGVVPAKASDVDFLFPILQFDHNPLRRLRTGENHLLSSILEKSTKCGAVLENIVGSIWIPHGYHEFKDLVYM